MADNFRLEIVTPESMIVDEDVQQAIAPGAQGQFGVLPDHTTFLSTLDPGAVSYKDKDGQDRMVFVSNGFAEVLPDKMTVLVESAERRRDIDTGRAQAALERAEKRLAEKNEDIDAIRAEAAMARAMARLKISEMRD